jgi:hypothetical protein
MGMIVQEENLSVWQRHPDGRQVSWLVLLVPQCQKCQADHSFFACLFIWLMKRANLTQAHAAIPTAQVYV